MGKTSLVRRYVFDVFDDKYLMSFGTKVSKKSMKINDAEVDLMIWDILGQKNYESLHAAYYRGASGALAVCDYTRPDTMKSMKSWIGSFRSVVGNMPVVILANKCDLEKSLQKSEVEEFGALVGCKVIETSAKTGQNVEMSFVEMGKALMEVVQ